MSLTTPIELTAALLTGVAEIDDQHQVLINTINEASEKLANDRSGELLERITRDLLAYAIYHFETEEKLIKRYGYDLEAAGEATAHLREHRQFSEQVVALRNEIHGGKTPSAAALLTFLNDWLVNHIRNTDKLLGAYIVGKTTSP